MPRSLRHAARATMIWAGAAACLCAVAACGEAPLERNASEDARIHRGMKEVEAGQARSDAKLKEGAVADRQREKDERRDAGNETR